MTATHKISQVTRRRFLHTTGTGFAAAVLPFPGRLFAKNRELVIKKIIVQEAKGRRLAPVAPNANGGRPASQAYDESEPILRIQTAQGLEGICRSPGVAKSELLKKLIGLDPFKMFQFGANDRILRPAAQYEALLAGLRRIDVALIDVIGRALKRPAAALLGETVRDSVLAYDSSLYMEEFLPREAMKDLVFIKGALPTDPVELLVRKAEWVVHTRPEGFKAIKIKIGRTKWMRTPEEALARDIAITNAIRKAVGPEVRILVDANRSYWGMPHMAWNYAQGVVSSNVYFMEEMFPEEDLPNMQEFKRRLRGLGPVKLAAGESNLGGIAEGVYTQRFDWFERFKEPLIDVEQADLNAHGFLYIRSKAAKQAKLGMTFAPHNFASKMGFYAQVHIGMVTPNWEVSETDDSQFPALVPEGIVLKNGLAKLTGAPGLGVSLAEEHLQKPTIEI